MIDEEYSMLLVFGSINFDIVIRVPHLPAPGETVLGGEAAHEPGGKGANQAHAARLFGTAVRLVGAIGEDPFGTRALQRLQSAGVDLSGVQELPGVASGLACISVAASGENAIAVAPGANAHVASEWIDDATLGQCQALLVQGEVPLAEVLALARRFRRRGSVVVMNPAPMPSQPLPPGAFDWLVVNHTEMQQLCANLGIAEGERLERGRRLAQHQQCNVVMTLGADGALLVRRDGRHAHCPALAGAAVDADVGPVIDTTGAGDTLAGVFAAALAEAIPDEQALRYAIVASGLSCRRHGTQAAQPTRARIDATLAAWESLLVFSD
jgi:ribokinase